MNRRVVEWKASGDVSGAARLWGEPASDVRTDLAGLPDAAVPLAVVEEPSGDGDGDGHVAAAALFLPSRLLGADRCALARLATASERDVDAAEMLVRWAEARATTERARRLEVVERGAAGIAAWLEARGYRQTDALVRMRRGPPRPVPSLPVGLVERALADAGVDAWVEVANTSFAAVPFSAPATRDEYARLIAEPGFDATLVRIVIDDLGPVAFLHGAISSEGVAEVRSIGVAPRAQGRGLGRWVLRRCEQLLDERAPREVILRVAASNGRASELYVREGYLEISRQRAWARVP